MPLVRAVVLNDSRKGEHPGCMLVMQQLLSGCNAAGIEVTNTFATGRVIKESILKRILTSDIVIINGEGTLHHDSRGAMLLTELAQFACNAGKPVALINTVWEKNAKANTLLSCATVRYARECLSAAAMRRAGFEVHVTPDLVMTCDLFPDPPSPGPVIVTDDVRHDKALLLASYARARGLGFYRMAPGPLLYSPRSIAQWSYLWASGGFTKQLRLDRLDVFKQARIIVTGRFHGVCLAILAQRPFLAISSNTHKIEGLLADAQLGPCGSLLPDSELQTNPVQRIADAVREIDLLSQQESKLSAYKQCCHLYSERARREANEMFHTIAKLGREKKIGA